MSEKSLFEREREYNAQLLQLYEEGALELYISIKTEWTNEKMRQIVETLRKNKINHYTVNRAILHPTKDVGPKNHEKHITVHLIVSPLKIESIVETLQKIGQTDIDNIQSGALLFTRNRDHVNFLIKEEEP